MAMAPFHTIPVLAPKTVSGKFLIFHFSVFGASDDSISTTSRLRRNHRHPLLVLWQAKGSGCLPLVDAEISNRSHRAPWARWQQCCESKNALQWLSMRLRQPKVHDMQQTFSFRTFCVCCSISRLQIRTLSQQLFSLCRNSSRNYHNDIMNCHSSDSFSSERIKTGSRAYRTIRWF